MRPIIILINPKNVYNVARTVRGAACFDASEVLWTGGRIFWDRLPREERHRAFRHVAWSQCMRPFDLARVKARVPVAIEIMPDATPLPVFVHPPNAVYVFGPEDGSLDDATKGLCHHHVWIPARQCLNLADALHVVMYDRWAKGEWWKLALDRR